MGTRTLVNHAYPGISDKPKPRLGTIDAPLLVVVIALCVFGLLMVFSASWDFSMIVYGSAMYMFIKQVLWMIVGVAVAYVFSRIDYHSWRTLVVPLMILTVLMLIGVLIVNEVRLGAARTLAEGSIQPSELAKLVTVIYLAVWMYAKRQNLQDINLGLIPLAIIIGTIGGLIYIQPDLSATATIFLLGGLLFFLAGGDLRQIIFLLAIAVAVGWIVVQISATGRARFGSYWSGMKDPLQASYHVRRSFEAIVKGGWLGVGLGRANTKLTGLPVQPTDSIFAVIAEELGLFGALGVITLYGLLVWRGLYIARRSPDMLGSLLASGLTFWLAAEAAINMAVMVGLLPFAGNALPFISAGGSNLTASLGAIGVLMNIARQGTVVEASDEEWRKLGATLDLRRRNRGRRLSRPVRSAGSEE
jgi:cell division protein FtsW